MHPAPAITWVYAALPQLSSNRARSEEHTSELQSHLNLVCRLLLEKKNNKPTIQQDPNTLFNIIMTMRDITPNNITNRYNTKDTTHVRNTDRGNDHGHESSERDAL